MPRHQNTTGQGHYERGGDKGHGHGYGHDEADTIVFAITDDVDEARAVIDLPGIDVLSVEANDWFTVSDGDLVLLKDVAPGDDPEPVLAWTSAGALWLDGYDVSGG